MHERSRPLRVIIVLESVYPAIGGGGAERQVQTLCRVLPKHAQVKVVTPRLPNTHALVQETVEDVPVTRIPYPQIRKLGGLIMLFKLACMIYRSRREIDVIYSHIAHNMSVVCCLMGIILRRPVIVKLTGWTELEHGILGPKRSLSNLWRRWAIKKASFVQATSTQLAESLLARGFSAASIVVIPNAVDTARFSPAPEIRKRLRRAQDLEEKFVATFVGRLVPEKSLETLFKAWQEAVPAEASARLLIVGDGNLFGWLRQYSERLGIQGQVIFAGVSDEVENVWRMSDLGLLPSIYEGLSNSLLEAMSSGVPVIGSKVSGTVDVISAGKTGWLFEPRDVNGLASCIREALHMSESERAQMGNAARSSIIEHASVETVVGRLLQLYQVGGTAS